MSVTSNGDSANVVEYFKFPAPHPFIRPYNYAKQFPRISLALEA
jgi:hypothetical protein